MTWNQLWKKMSKEERMEVRAFAYDVENEVKGNETKTHIYTEYKIKKLLPYHKGAGKEHRNVWVLRPNETDYYKHWKVVQEEKYQPLHLNFLTLDGALEFLKDNHQLVSLFYHCYGCISVTFKKDGKTESKKYI